MKFAKYAFLISGIIGILVLVPQYFLIEKNGADFPPAITHSEYYYGFTGVALAFQIVFIIISTDPLRYRPLMLASVAEKLAWIIPVTVLYSQNRVSDNIFAAGLLDAAFGTLFLISWFLTRKRLADA